MRKRSKATLLTTIILLAFTSIASATTIVMPSDEQLVEKSPLIVIGTVLRSAVTERQGGLRTESVIQVERTLKGSAPSELTVSELGGVLGDRYNIIFGAPEYAAGEHVLLFLAPWKEGLYRTRDLFVGKFSEREAADGTRFWFRPRNPDATVLDHSLQPMLVTTQRSADGFEKFILDRVAQHSTRISYEVENPLLQPRAEVKVAPSRIRAEFTLIADPTIYRWSSFDRGSSAVWFSVGSQPGYSGGGVNELQSGINAWTSYSAAKILYNYAGVSSRAPGGLHAPNGVNEVVFNDQTNEVDGSFNPRTGGVVGVGGFNNTASGGSWSGPFDADSSHQARSYGTVAITEANLVIQDGVSPGNGISSATLAEIIAHEFGHTIGLGHSLDSSALMYYSVTGGGPSLKPDDQVAARWLYPNGANTPPPSSLPNAPSALTASLTGANSVRLDWSDNASNETAQTIWVSTGGSYSAMGDVPANSTGANLSNLASNTAYAFYITANNGAGRSAGSNTARVTTPAPATATVSADFDFTPVAPRPGDAVSFVDRSTGTPTSWSWNFGDGSTSSSRNPSHVFAGSGVYNVTLTAASGSSSNVKIRSVTVTAASSGAFESVVAVTAQTAGVGSTYWRTELSIFNASPFAVDLELVYIPGAGGTSQSRRSVLSPKGSLTYANALRDLFGLSSGAGALIVRGNSISGTPQLKVASRTFTDSGSGTYGQFVPDVRSDDAQATSYLTGLESDASYRTNVGFVNRSGVAVSATLTLLDQNGAVVGTNSVAVPPSNFQQVSLISLFPSAPAGAGRTLKITASAAHALISYASIIDNRSQDPVYVAAGTQTSDGSLIIPAVARADGANGTYWRSDVTLHNPATGSLNVALRFWRAGADNRAAGTRSYAIAAGRTLVLSDVVSTLGAGNGSGALEVLWTAGTKGPVITSRTYTTRVGDDATFGQSIDASSAAAFSSRSIVTGLRSDSQYRTNIGLVNRGDQGATVNLTLYSSFGNVLGTTDVTIAAKSQSQVALASLFPNVGSGSLGSVTLEASSSATTILAYGSVVDNISGDPIFVTGE